MEKNLWYFLIVAFSAVLLRCGGEKKGTENPATPPPVAPTSGEAKYYLTLFAGYPCKSCNTELPQIRDRLQSDLGTRAALVKVRVYVVAGENWTAATPAVAQSYGQKLNLPFEMLVDDHCNTHYFNYYTENEQCFVPAALIQNIDGTVIQKFDAGKLTVDLLMNRLNAVAR